MRLKEVRSILEEFNPQFPLSKGNFHYLRERKQDIIYGGKCIIN